jgi:hypothetical protein
MAPNASLGRLDAPRVSRPPCGKCGGIPPSHEMSSGPPIQGTCPDCKGLSHLTPADKRLLDELCELQAFLSRARNELWAATLSPVDREHLEELVRAMARPRSEG